MKQIKNLHYKVTGFSMTMEISEYTVPIPHQPVPVFVADACYLLLGPGGHLVQQTCQQGKKNYALCTSRPPCDNSYESCHTKPACVSLNEQYQHYFFHYF